MHDSGSVSEPAKVWSAETDALDTTALLLPGEVLALDSGSVSAKACPANPAVLRLDSGNLKLLGVPLALKL
eukprot:1160532-Pelagomonas_calceolata.AAC.8